MALTQQLARVSPEYLATCRRTAAESPEGGPGWDPPEGDTLDLDWGIWGLLWYCHRAQIDGQHLSVLERPITGDPSDDIGFLNHPDVYDGFGDPPTLLSPTAVGELASDLGTLDLDRLLRGLPQSQSEAAVACGLGEGFNGNPRDYLVQHFTSLRDFYAEAHRRGFCVLAWVD